jgi:uncharacterized membrane-anchored protein
MKTSFTGLVFGALLLGGWPLLAIAQAGSSDDAAHEAFMKELRALKWVAGPQQVQLFGNSSLKVPAGYLFLNPEDTTKLQALEHNLGNGHQYYFAPNDLHWGATFSFKDDGYVKDDEKIDADAIFKSIQNATEQANATRRERGWDEMQLVGWQTPPHYDSQSNHLEWAISGRDLKTREDIVNFNTRLLGRSGVMSIVLTTEPSNLTPSIAEFKTALSGFEYVPGQRYAEYKSGDKVAKYGLAALITGGAAAIAVKTGFWKVIVGALAAGWKFIAAAFVGLFGWFSRRFKKSP